MGSGAPSFDIPGSAPFPVFPRACQGGHAATFRLTARMRGMGARERGAPYPVRNAPSGVSTKSARPLPSTARRALGRSLPSIFARSASPDRP